MFRETTYKPQEKKPKHLEGSPATKPELSPNTTLAHPLYPETEFNQINNELVSRYFELRNYFEKHKIREDEFGRATGRLYVRQLALINYEDRPSHELKAARETILSMDRFYQGMFGEADFAKFRSGFMAEYVLEKTLAQDVGYEVYEATKDEDIKEKVDFWLKLDDEGTGLERNIVACQAKSMDSPIEYVYPISNEYDIDNIIIQLGSSMPDIDAFKTNSLRLLRQMEIHSNVQTVIIILPTTQSENARYNMVTGEADKELANDLYNEIDRKLLRYKEA